MAIEIERSKNKHNGLMLVVLAIFLVVVFLVFLSLKKNLGVVVNKADVQKVIDKDTRELENVSKNMDKNIDAIFQREDFKKLYRHNDMGVEYEKGKQDPFKSF
jgi:hypothetical protein